MNLTFIISCICCFVLIIICVVAIIGGWSYIRSWFEDIIKPIPLPLQCPKGSTLKGLICYENCPTNYTSDGTIGCYENCPPDWKGTQTIAHCQKHTIYSPVGTVDTIPKDCATGLTNYAGLCYDVPEGWYVSSPGLMTMKAPCPPGTTDSGITCYYERGAGYPWKFGDPITIPINLENAKKRCEADHGVGNCEMDGLIWYPKCRSGYTNFGCCICNFLKVKPIAGHLPTKCPGNKELYGRLCYNPCSPSYERRGDNIEFCSSKCPPSSIDIGIGGCQRKRVDVGGKPLTEVGVCPEGYVREGALCYKR